MNLADRINLYYKIGKFVDIPFDTYEENDLVREVNQTLIPLKMFVN